ncbi:sucrose synthase [Medicago truncatula]|uniref:Sucrose synthase n=1 Tax=Medicago truncatula TaxID=3880 RepID=G7L3M9_MEDTR|nr:sucrose synthase [Medicago truncatula]
MQQKRNLKFTRAVMKAARRVYSMNMSSQVKSSWLQRRVFLKSWFCLGFAVDKNNKNNAHKARYLGVIVLPPWVALAVRLIANVNYVLELDFEPFTASFPRPIGGGVVVDEEKKGRG